MTQANEDFTKRLRAAQEKGREQALADTATQKAKAEEEARQRAPSVARFKALREQVPLLLKAVHDLDPKRYRLIARDDGANHTEMLINDGSASHRSFTVEFKHWLEISARDSGYYQQEELAGEGSLEFLSVEVFEAWLEDFVAGAKTPRKAQRKRA